MYLLPNLIINSLLQSIESLTFTGQYIHWDLFGLKQGKTILIDMLTHQALKIYSKSTLKYELESIHLILVENGYPEFFLVSRIFKKLSHF